MNADMNTILKTEIQSKLETLSKNKNIWRDMKPEKRLSYLQKMLKRAQGIDHQAWGEDSSLQQGYAPKEPHGEVIAAAEEMLNSAIIVGTIRALMRTHKALVKSNQPPALKSRPSGVGSQHIASVFPYDVVDSLSNAGQSD